MGPTIILDKSALQALSQRELYFLFKHYFVVVAPVLLIEILADLKKSRKRGTLSESEVQTLATKLLGMDSVVNVHYRFPCIGSLIGREVPMTGQAVVSHGQDRVTEDGRRFTFFDDQAEQQAITCWQCGHFSDAEVALAERYRSTMDSLDYEGFKRRFKNLAKLGKAQDLSALWQVLAAWSLQPDTQMDCIRILMEEFNAPQKLKNFVFDRWLHDGMPLFSIFAPYACYCFMASAFFHLGIAFGLIGTKKTNRVDLEYFYYTPFAMVFCSGDEFHRALFPFLARPDQTFIHRDELKADLQWLAAEWDDLTEAAKRERGIDYGHYPPGKSDSVTHRVWQKYMRPWEPGSGNRALSMTDEERSRLMEYLRPFMDAIDKQS